MCRDYTEFLLLINAPFTSSMISQNRNLSVPEEIWMKLDITVRVGESLYTKENEEK